MTRALAALLLACFAFTQALAADCPLAASAAGARAEAHAHPSQDGGDAHAAGVHAHASAVSHVHASLGTHHAGAPRKAPPEHHHAAECVLAMACGVAALPRRAPESAVLPQPFADVAWPATSAYLSPSLGSDPPPPRLA